MFIKILDIGLQWVGEKAELAAYGTGHVLYEGIVAATPARIGMAVGVATIATGTMLFRSDSVVPEPKVAPVPTLPAPPPPAILTDSLDAPLPPELPHPAVQYEAYPPDTTVLTVSKSLAHAIQLESQPEAGLSPEELADFMAVTTYEGSTPFLVAISSMSAGSQGKFYRLAKDYKRMTGKKMRITSAWRSVEKQASLHSTMPAGLAASAYSSAHAIGAMDIDRRGMGSKQVDEMKRLNLLNKYGLWNPPEVGEPWHIEDPDTVYFRYLERKNPDRGIYRNYVKAGLTGKAHDARRKADGVFTVTDTHRRTNAAITTLLANRGIVGDKAALFREYLLFSLRAESLYGKRMVSPTGALGFWQFTGPVAAQYKLKYPMQLRESARATLDLAIDNSRGLEKRGIPVTVPNLYYSHMVGLRGNALVEAASGGQALSVEEVKTFDKVVSVNLPKAVKTKLYTEAGMRLPGVDVKTVALAYRSVFTDRFNEYANDVAYVQQLTS